MAPAQKQERIFSCLYPWQSVQWKPFASVAAFFVSLQECVYYHFRNKEFKLSTHRI